MTGYTAYDPNAVPGTGTILGVIVHDGADGIVAFRNANVYLSTGSGWSKLNGNADLSSYLSAFSISAAGSGYVVGDLVLVPGGTLATGGLAAAVEVISVNGSGGITGGTIVVAGPYTTAPTNPVTVTGGTGTGMHLSFTATSLARTTPAKVRYTSYNWGTESVVFVDGVNYPVKYDGTNYTVLYNAPKGASSVHQFENYMFFGVGNDLFVSAPTSENDFNGSDGAAEFNMGFPIVNIAPWHSVMYVFGQDRISSLTGTVFGGGTPDVVVTGVTNRLGCIAPDTLQEIGGDLVFLAADGLRTVAGTTRLLDSELGTFTDPVHDNFLQFVSLYRQNSIGQKTGSLNFTGLNVRGKTQYRIFASDTSTLQGNAQGWNCCIRSSTPSYFGNIDNWEFFRLLGILVYCADSNYINGLEVIVHGAYDGFVYQQELGNSFSGEYISAYIQFPYNGFDDPELRKTFYKVKVDVLVEGITAASGQYSFDWGDPGILQPPAITLGNSSIGFAAYDQAVSLYDGPTTTYDGGTSLDFQSNTVGSGKNLSILMYSTDMNPGYTIRSIILDYQINGRR